MRNIHRRLCDTFEWTWKKMSFAESRDVSVRGVFIHIARVCTWPSYVVIYVSRPATEGVSRGRSA